VRLRRGQRVQPVQKQRQGSAARGLGLGCARPGIVNLAELAAAGMIDWVAQVGEGLGLVEAGVPSYAGFRFPAEIISHGVWLYLVSR
jgi:hypothetical protein